MTSAASVAELSGIAVAGNPAAIAFGKKCKETAIHGEKPRLGILQQGLVQVCTTIGWKNCRTKIARQFDATFGVGIGWSRSAQLSTPNRER